MGTKLSSWRQQIKQHSFITTGIIVVLLVVMTLIVVEVRLYGTGFAGKTLFDWLNLLGVLAIPAVVGLGAAWYTSQQAKESEANRAQQIKESDANRDKRHQTELQIAEDQQKENAFQKYLDSMSDLLLNHDLRHSKPGEEVRQVARERTLIALRRLNAARNIIVVQFLQDAGLLSGENIVIDFSNTDLSNTDLSGATLVNANLCEADLSGAGLSWAHLRNAHLDGANLSGALQPHLFVKTLA